MVSMYRIPTTETAIIADLKNPPGNSGSNARRRSNNQEQRSPPMALPPPMFPNTNLSQFQLSKVRVPVITPSKRAGNENKHMLGSEAKNHVSTSKSASRESKKNNEDGSDAEEINPRDQNHFVESKFQLQDPSQQQNFDWNQKEKAQSQTEDQNSNPMINFESQNAVAYEDPYKILQSIENMESLDSVEEYLVDGIGNGDPNSTFRLDESVQLRTSMIDSSSPPTKDLLSHGNSMLTTVPALRISEVNVHSPEHCFLDPNVTESNAVNHSSTLTVTPASFHQSPSPKQLDWHCPNMDQFFRDSLTGSVGSFASDNESNHDEVESNRDSPERIVAFRQSHSRRSSLSCNLPEEPKPSLPKQVEETSETSNKSKSGHSSSPAPSLRPISLVPRNRVQDSLQVDSIFCSSKTSGNVSRNDYDDDLLSKIRMTKPPTMSLPPCLFPNKSEGTQRVLIRGGTVKSSNGCFNDASDTEMINNGTMKSTSSYHEFLMDLFPAFEGCTFLLPSLKKRKNQLRSNNSQCKIKISSFGNIKLNSRLSEVKPVGPTSGELAIGKRRVETAICAFGGSIKRKTAPKRVQHSSIFRKKEPISDSAESEEKQNSRKRKKYEEKQKQQYFENGSRLSWEVTYTFDDDDGPMKKRTPSGLTVFSSPTRRKKYRCKLCGQLKQNHTCPFEESLLRSIGVMVYPSINPHVADEPGSLAPPLSEMNNFALVGSASFAESSPVSSAGKTMETKADIIKVSPPQRRKECQDSRDTVNGSTTKDVVTAEKNEEVGIKSIFQPAMEIAPEQYRLVTPLREWEISSETGSYSYPAVPLTHAQRKSASVKLFGISKKLPSLTQECAEVLKEAREGNQWDLAVAELTTQVICVTRCSESKDYKLEGLRRYLLTLGIAC